MPVRERSFRQEAVVLKHSDWGEADRMLWLYTREMGKVRAIAKGVRKMRSRKAGHLEPFTRVNLLLARGRDLLIVTQAETIDAYLNLRESLLGVGYAAYVVELLDRFTYDEDENAVLYRLLVNTLQRLNTLAEPSVALRYYEVHLLDLLGYRPQLTVCLGCGEEIRAQDQYFSASQGGVYCPNCGLNANEARPISMPALKYLRHFQRSNFSEASRARPALEVQREIERLLYDYLRFILERDLNSPDFIRHVHKAGFG
jgi:DNA repair protein RecO (recombination protein O)